MVDPGMHDTPDLLIIDPLQQFLGAGTNYGPIARAMMNDLTRCADKHQVAIIGVIHWAAYRNKIMGHEEIARIAPGSNATAGNRCEPGDVARFGGFPILGEVMCGMRLTIRVVVGCDGTVRAFGRRFPIRTRKQVVHVKR